MIFLSRQIAFCMGWDERPRKLEPNSTSESLVKSCKVARRLTGRSYWSYQGLTSFECNSHRLLPVPVRRSSIPSNTSESS
jgi:hypothetical protein